MGAAPFFLCPICLRKLLHSTQAEPLPRYHALHTWYASHGCAEQCVWLAARIHTLKQGVDVPLLPLLTMCGDAEGGCEAKESEGEMRACGTCVATGAPEACEMREFLTPHAKFICDVCEARVPEGGTMHGCRVADYDECEDCFNAAALVRTDSEVLAGKAACSRGEARAAINSCKGDMERALRQLIRSLQEPKRATPAAPIRL